MKKKKKLIKKKLSVEEEMEADILAESIPKLPTKIISRNMKEFKEAVTKAKPGQFLVLDEAKKEPELEYYEKAEKQMKEALITPSVAHNINEIKEVKKGQGLSFWQRRKLYSSPAFTHIVTMFYDNQTCKTFVIKGLASYFINNKKGYLLYKPACFYNINQSQSHLFYAEGHIMPIDAIKIVGGKEVSFAIHPDNFREIWESQELKIVLTAKSLKKWIFYVILITGITLFAVFLILLISAGPIIAQILLRAQGG